MPSSQGQFTWCELMTTDTASAASFYRDVVGWKTGEAGPAHPGYTILSAGDVGVGGVLELPQRARDSGARPGWIGYIGADDVDAMAEAVLKAGGSVHHGPADIEQVGRFAVVADPQGAVFTLFKPVPGMPPPDGGQGPGRVGWHELHAAEWSTAFDFYAGLFGWTKTDAIDMGPMGIYQTFATGPAGGMMTGGMMTKSEAVPKPNWLYYFTVDDINAAVTRLKSAGGQLLNGPLEVPGGMWIVQCTDPQGAMFAMVGVQG